MVKLSNIDIVYEYLKQKKESVAFPELIDVVIQQTSNKNLDKNLLMTSLYTTLVCDNRFSLTPEGWWALRNNPKVEDLKKQLSEPLIKLIDFPEDDEYDYTVDDDETEIIIKEENEDNDDE